MPSEKHLLAVASALLVAGIWLFAYMRGPAKLIARPPQGSTVGYEMLDLCIGGYTQQDVEMRLQAWSADQIATYRAVHLGPDIVFPWVYSGFFFVTAVLVLGRAFPGRILWPFLLVLPALTLTADYVENYLISFVILPAGSPADAATVAWASCSTVCKWLLVLLNMVVVVVGLALCLWWRCPFRRPRQAPRSDLDATTPEQGSAG